MLARLAGLARQSRLHGKSSARLAGLRFFHVIAKMIFSVSHRPAEIPANLASPVNRASPPHLMSRAGSVEGLALSAEMTVQPGFT